MVRKTNDKSNRILFIQNCHPLFCLPLFRWKKLLGLRHHYGCRYNLFLITDFMSRLSRRPHQSSCASQFSLFFLWDDRQWCTPEKYDKGFWKHIYRLVVLFWRHHPAAAVWALACACPCRQEQQHLPRKTSRPDVAKFSKLVNSFGS